MNFILMASTFIFPLITFPYISRILLPEGNGKIAFAASIISYFSMVAMLGIPTYGIRACAKVRNNKEELSKTVHELFIINVTTTIITYIALFISIFTIAKFENYRVLLMVTGSGIILNTFGMNWLYSALEQYAYITVRSIVFKVLSIILMFLFVHKIENYVIYAAITVFASSGSYILNIINIRKYIYIKPFKNYNIKQHVKPILTFFAMTVATSIYLNLDATMLGFIKGDNEVGLYNAAIKIRAILTSLVASLGTVLLPRMSFLIKTNQMDEFKKITAKAINFVLILSLPLTIYFVSFSKEVIILLSGMNFLGSVPAMQIITPTIIFVGLTNILGIQVLVPQNREKCVLISVIVGALTDILFNIIFIPKMGAAGAALGTLIAEFTVLVTQIAFLKDFLIEIMKNNRLRFVIISSIMSSIGIILFKRIYIHSVFMSLVLSATAFFGLYGMILLIQKEPLVYGLIMEGLNKLKGHNHKKTNT